MKPTVYAPAPDFDQLTQYVIQLPPADMGDYIYVGNEVRAVEIDEEPGMPE